MAKHAQDVLTSLEEQEIRGDARSSFLVLSPLCARVRRRDAHLRGTGMRIIASTRRPRRLFRHRRSLSRTCPPAPEGFPTRPPVPCTGQSDPDRHCCCFVRTHPATRKAWLTPAIRSANRSVQRCTVALKPPPPCGWPPRRHPAPGGVSTPSNSRQSACRAW